ncbi:MAG: cyclase family protein [Desulfomonile tiedjei]|nr:cyclase family protein [Desulfomonile tiedjei]
MPLYDATVSIHEGMLLYPGDPPFKLRSLYRVEKGDPFNLCEMSMGTHIGTHVDPPAHYLENAAGVDQIPIEVLIGPGIILDMRGRPCVDRPALEKSALAGHSRVLLKTDNGPRLLQSEFVTDYVYLTEDAAEFLVERGVQLIGTDYLSIERFQTPGAPVHHRLLNAGVLIVEGVNLLEIPPGPCKIYCLPLKIKDADGAPARVLIETALRGAT